MILEDKLRGCVIELHGRWEELLPLAEFSYNNSFQSTIQMTPYEALYGRKCRTPLYWTKLGERKIMGPDIITVTKDKVNLIQDQLKVTFDR